MEQYPAVRFMVSHGRKLAIPVGLALPVLVLLGILFADWHWVWGIAAIAAGVIVGFAFRTFAELTQIIADMLLPQ
jgi:F0F1-type ATP synthase assembly protein I